MPTTKINLPTQINLEQFISDQAHDMRTPFNHIIGFSKMTLNTVGDAPLTDFQKEDLNTIYRSGMRALTVLNGLIDIARINRQEKEVHLSEIVPDQLFEQSLAYWKKFNPGSAIKIEHQILPPSTTFLADDQLMRQIVTGFITYVAEYCEAHTQVVITVAEETDWVVFTFTSKGTKARQPSEIDLEMIGFVNRSLIEMQKGQIRQAEENDEGAVIQFGMPKK